jgi:hypothetical protein
MASQIAAALNELGLVGSPSSFQGAGAGAGVRHTADRTEGWSGSSGDEGVRGGEEHGGAGRRGRDLSRRGYAAAEAGRFESREDELDALRREHRRLLYDGVVGGEASERTKELGLALGVESARCRQLANEAFELRAAMEGAKKEAEGAKEELENERHRGKREREEIERLRDELEAARVDAERARVEVSVSSSSASLPWSASAMLCDSDRYSFVWSLIPILLQQPGSLCSILVHFARFWFTLLDCVTRLLVCSIGGSERESAARRGAWDAIEAQIGAEEGHGREGGGPRREVRSRLSILGP